MTLATWGGVTGRNILIQSVNSTCHLMVECFEWVSSKRSAFQFSPNWLIMERSQAWPDLGSPILKSRDKKFIDSLTDINLVKFQGDRSLGVAMAIVRTFSEARTLDITWWPELEWPGSEIFTTCAEKMYEQLCQKRRRSAPPFFSYRRKTWRGVFKHPSPGPARVKR